MKSSIKLENSFIFFASLALFCYGIFSRELVGFETRFALFAKEMLWHGPTFFPFTYGKPYPDYPAGLPFLNYIFAKLFGHFNTFVAILPCALASAGTLSLLYAAIAPIRRHWARMAVLLCLFTYGFTDAARTLGTDALVMFAATWAFYVCLKQIQKQSFNFIWLALPFIFGFCIRGPIGLIIPAAVIVATLAAHNQWRQIISFGIRAGTLLIILLIALIIAAAIQGGSHFIKDVLVMEIIGRMSDHRGQDFFAYFTYSFGQYAITYELAIVCIILFGKHIFTSNTQVSQLLKSFVLWALIVMIGMSIPEVRKIRYIMPIVPALAALSAYLWIASKTISRARIAVNILNGLCLALPFILLTLTAATLFIAKIKHLEFSAHYNSAFYCLILLGISSLYIFTNQPFEYAARNPKKVIGIGLASFLVALIFVIKPIDVSLHKNAPFVEPVLAQLKPNESVTFYQVDLDAEPIQFLAYSKNPVSVLYSDAIDISHPSNTIYITSVASYDALPATTKAKIKEIQRGRLGHVNMVAFEII